MCTSGKHIDDFEKLIPVSWFVIKLIFKCWKSLRGFSGIGLSTTYSMFFLSSYYIMLMVWSMYYFFSSFQSPLPWSQCRESDLGCSNEATFNSSIKSPEQFFWEDRVLDLSSGLPDVGGFNWPIFACLAAAWVACWISVAKGVKD